jgi:hypothetical protein
MVVSLQMGEKIKSFVEKANGAFEILHFSLFIDKSPTVATI